MSKTTARDLGDLGSGNEIERAEHIVLSSPYGGADKINIRQQKFVEVSGVIKHEEAIKHITRNFDDVKTESYTFDGVTATVEQMRGLIAKAVDAWRTEDAS